jgi:trehalose utilization protein
MSLITEFPKTTDCMELQTQVEKLLVKKDYYARNFMDSELSEITPFLADKKALMVTLQCDKKNLATKSVMVDYYIQKYGAVDKDRIEPDSIAQAKKRIYVGAGILVLALGILFVATKK